MTWIFMDSRLGRKQGNQFVKRKAATGETKNARREHLKILEKDAKETSYSNPEA